MQHFVLRHSQPEKEFKLLSPNSRLNILTVTMIKPSINIHNQSLSVILAKSGCYLNIELKHIESKADNMIWKKVNHPIALASAFFVSPTMLRINHSIKNEEIVYDNGSKKFYESMIIRLIQNASEEIEIGLQIDYEGYEIS